MKNVSFTIAAPLNDASITITDHAMEMIVYEILENSKKFHPNRIRMWTSCIEAT